MRVVCKSNNLKDIPDPQVLDRLKKYILMPGGEVDLEIGREYTVYGVVFWDNSPWYYLCSEEDDDYPKPFAAEFFNISDGRLSAYWRLCSLDHGNGDVLSLLVFEEWGQDPSFYERLIDGDQAASESFIKYRNLMDDE